MKKILLPTIDYPPARGGVARYIGAIMQTYPDQVTLLKLPTSSKLPSLIVKLWRQSRQYDAIWTHHVLPIGTAAWLTQRFTQKPYVVFLHGLDFDLARRNAWKRWLLGKVLNSAERIVTNSEALATEVQQFLSASRLPLVVYPTLEDALVEASRRSAEPREKVNLHKLAELAVGVARVDTPMFVPQKPAEAVDGPLRLLTVARLVSRKGHVRVLEAMKTLPNVSYTIVGDGPLLPVIEQAIKTFKLEGRVTLLRDASDEQLPDLYRQADVFVMPTLKTTTDREGFGIVYLEAQVFGVPVIASKQAGVMEAVRADEGGVLIGEGSDELPQAIERLRHVDLRRKLGARGRARVLKEFTREQQMYKLRELL